jgi:formamidopyrimidine-DNA glycosylase
LEEIMRLHDAIVQVLNEGIALRGTQRDLFGRKGQAIHRRNIFEKTGEPCPRCGTLVEKLQYLGGACYLCPSCQR